MKPLLFLRVGGDLFSSITSKSVELTTKLVNRPPALVEAAELLTLTVYESFGNVMLTKSLTELIPISGRSSRTHVQKVFPPRARCTLEVVGGIVDLVSICNMSCLEIP